MRGKISKFFNKALVLLVVGLSLFPTIAKAQNVPTPNNGRWILEWDNEDKDTLIKLQSPENANEYPYEFKRFSAEGKLYVSWGVASRDRYISESAVKYLARNTSPPLAIITTKDDDRLTNRREYVRAICALQDSDNAPPTPRKIVYSRQSYLLVYQTADQEEFKCLTKTDNTAASVGDNWINNSLNDFSNDDRTKDLIRAAWAAIKNDQVQLSEAREGSPAAENIEACSSKHIQPMFHNPADATRDEFRQGFEQFKENILENSGNDGGETYLEEYFGNQDNIDEIFQHLTEEDLRQYRTFYGDPAQNFPTVSPSEGLYYETINLFHQIEAVIPQENRELWDNTMMKTIASAPVGVLAFASGWGPAGVAAATAGTMAFYTAVEGFLQNSMTASATNEVMKRIYLYKLTNMYFQANLEFNQCLADKGDPFANTNPRLLEMVTSLESQSTDVMRGVESGRKTVCSVDSGGGLLPNTRDMMIEGMCNMARIFKGWADSAFLTTLAWMKASIGLVSNPTDENSIDTDDPRYNPELESPTTPEGGTTSSINIGNTSGSTGSVADGSSGNSGGNDGGSDDDTDGASTDDEDRADTPDMPEASVLRDAKTNCESERASTRHENPDLWELGPCLEHNFHGWAVDVAHPPGSRTTEDNDPDNQCPHDAGKFIELDYSCEFIRVGSF